MALKQTALFRVRKNILVKFESIFKMAFWRKILAETLLVWAERNCSMVAFQQKDFFHQKYQLPTFGRNWPILAKKTKMSMLGLTIWSFWWEIPHFLLCHPDIQRCTRLFMLSCNNFWQTLRKWLIGRQWLKRGGWQKLCRQFETCRNNNSHLCRISGKKL